MAVGRRIPAYPDTLLVHMGDVVRDSENNAFIVVGVFDQQVMGREVGSSTLFLLPHCRMTETTLSH